MPHNPLAIHPCCLVWREPHPSPARPDNNAKSGQHRQRHLYRPDCGSSVCTGCHVHWGVAMDPACLLLCDWLAVAEAHATTTATLKAAATAATAAAEAER